MRRAHRLRVADIVRHGHDVRLDEIEAHGDFAAEPELELLRSAGESIT